MSTTVVRASESIAEFCRSNGISRAFYFKLRKEGRGPREMRVGRRRLISQEAAADWRRRMEQVYEGAQR